ncbi:hypothetical protein TrVE_jg14059 [Triparma verrucosa]|uniref:Uncharacterized protein n=1 Tax=Triparma verrucosa TaxID=1606542 RepID=A0A9W7EYS8_9STRA|nr:hypothetical protein TrVE_jg14059 [Triparma verrucosa]
MPPKTKNSQGQKQGLRGETDESGMDMGKIKTNPLTKAKSTSVGLGTGGEEPTNIHVNERTGSIHSNAYRSESGELSKSTAIKRQTFARGQSSLSYKRDDHDLVLGEVKKYVCYCKAHISKPEKVKCKNEKYILDLVKERHDEDPIGVVHAKYFQDPKGDAKYEIDGKLETDEEKLARLKATCQICEKCKSNMDMLRCPHLVHKIKEKEKRDLSMWRKLHRKEGSRSTNEAEMKKEFEVWKENGPETESYIIDSPSGSMKHSVQAYEQKKVKANEVEVHVKIMGISSLSLIDKQFKADIIVMYDWFDPEVVKLRQRGGSYKDEVEEEKSNLFKPEFLILNTVSDGEDAGKPTDKAEHRITNYENGTAKMTARYISKELQLEDSEMGTWPYSISVLPIILSCRKSALKHPNMRLTNKQLKEENAHGNFHRYADDYDKLVEFDFFREVLCDDHDKDVNSWLKEVEMWTWVKHVLHNEDEEVVKDQLMKMIKEDGSHMDIDEFFVTKDGKHNADQKMKEIQNKKAKGGKTKCEMQEEAFNEWLDTLRYREKVEKCFKKWCTELKKINEIKEQYTVKVLTYQDPGNLHWNVTYPYLILEVLSLLSWGTKPDEGGSFFDGRISILLTLLLTMVAFKNIISEKIPALPYLTLLDKFIIGGFIQMLLQGVYFMLLIKAIPENSEESEKIIHWDWIGNDYLVGLIFFALSFAKFWLTFKSGKLALLCQFRDFYPFTNGAPHKVRNIVLNAQFDNDSVVAKNWWNIMFLKYAGLHHGSFRHWIYKRIYTGVFKCWMPSSFTSPWTRICSAVWGENIKDYDFEKIKHLDKREEKFQKLKDD